MNQPSPLALSASEGPVGIRYSPGAGRGTPAANAAAGLLPIAVPVVTSTVTSSTTIGINVGLVLGTAGWAFGYGITATSH